MLEEYFEHPFPLRRLPSGAAGPHVERLAAALFADGCLDDVVEMDPEDFDAEVNRMRHLLREKDDEELSDSMSRASRIVRLQS